MSKSESPKLICAACNHANEMERVYCHNCGEKLDRSLLPKIEEVAAADDQKKVSKQVRKMMNPTRGNWLGTVKTFVLIVVFAAIVAAVFLACLPPDGVPPMKAGMPERRAGDLWESMMSSRLPVSLTFNEAEINYHLAHHPQLKPSEGLLGLKFERAFAAFTPGTVTLTAQRDAWGLTLYNSASFRLAVTDGKWSPEITGLRFGRLGFPPVVGKLASITLEGVGKAFAKEAKQSDRLEKIEPGEGTIKFVSKPAQ